MQNPGEFVDRRIRNRIAESQSPAEIKRVAQDIKRLLGTEGTELYKELCVFRLDEILGINKGPKQLILLNRWITAGKRRYVSQRIRAKGGSNGTV